MVTVRITAHADPVEPVVRFDTPDERLVLRQGKWSDWLHADFKLILLLKSVSGVFRLYLQQVHPYLRIYAGPVNLDPRNPALALSTPAGFSRTLAEELGPFYTQGIAEETSASRAGVFSKDEFLSQSHKVREDSLRMFRHELDRFASGLLFYYSSSVDQKSHMSWGRYGRDFLDIYRRMDDAVGEAMPA